MTDDELLTVEAKIKTNSGIVKIKSDYERDEQFRLATGKRLDTQIDLSDIRLTISGDDFVSFMRDLTDLLTEYRI